MKQVNRLSKFIEKQSLLMKLKCSCGGRRGRGRGHKRQGVSELGILLSPVGEF